MESERCVINATLELKLKDFRTSTEKVEAYQLHHDKQYDIIFKASGYPNGPNEDTAGWVVVLASLNGPQRAIDEKASYLNWTVSIIDREYNCRFPRSFEELAVIADFAEAKYLQKSFILDREDELLTDGVLLLRCDICFDLKKKQVFRMLNVGRSSKSKIPDDQKHSCIFGYRPQAVCSKSGFFKAFEYTSELSKSEKLQESGKNFNVYLVYDGFSSTSLESKQLGSGDENDLWKFDTSTASFLLSLEQNVGSLLISSSPVISRGINSSMKEKEEKHFELTNVESETFQSVLFYLDCGDLRSEEYEETAKVYNFSHFYGMEELQKKCAENLVKLINTEADSEELEKTAAIYSDEYLLTLLESRRQKDGFSDSKIVDDRSNYDCYT